MVKIPKGKGKIEGDGRWTMVKERADYELDIAMELADILGGKNRLYAPVAHLDRASAF